LREWDERTMESMGRYVVECVRALAVMSVFEGRIRGVDSADCAGSTKFPNLTKHYSCDVRAIRNVADVLC
jgi:hypothetical protein